MIVLPSYIEGILFGRRENKAKWNANRHGEMKVKIVKRDGPDSWSDRALALVQGWEWWGRAKAGAELRDGQRPRGVPGEQSITHLRSPGCPETWVPTRHLKSHPDLWEQPVGEWGGKKKSHFWGLPVLACQGWVWGAAPPSSPRCQRFGSIHVQWLGERSYGYL